MAYTCSGCGAPGRITTCRACRARRLACGFVLWFAPDGQPLARLARFLTLAAAQQAAAAREDVTLSWREPGIDYAGWTARHGDGLFLVLQESPADVTPLYVPSRIAQARRVAS